MSAGGGSSLTSITGSALALAGLLGGIGAFWTNNTNKKLSREQMDFMKEMSNTAVSRSVADMRNAGINPILAHASPASTPSPQLPHMENPFSHAVQAASSFLGLAVQREQLHVLGTQAELNQSAARKNRADIISRFLPYITGGLIAGSKYIPRVNKFMRGKAGVYGLILSVLLELYSGSGLMEKHVNSAASYLNSLSAGGS